MTWDEFWQMLQQMVIAVFVIGTAFWLMTIPNLWVYDRVFRRKERSKDVELDDLGGRDSHSGGAHLRDDSGGDVDRQEVGES